MCEIVELSGCGIGAMSNELVVTNGAELGGDGKPDWSPAKYESTFGVVSSECLLICPELISSDKPDGGNIALKGAGSGGNAFLEILEDPGDIIDLLFTSSRICSGQLSRKIQAFLGCPENA